VTIIKQEEQTMKKSDAYHLAMIAVMATNTISVESKIEVMRVLLDQESLEKFCEKQGEENETL
jgi:hypothetical protein